MEQDDKNIIPPNDARNYRIEENLSLSDIAFLLDIKNVGRVSEWENGKSNPGIEHLFTLGLIYHRSSEQIYYNLQKKLAKKLAIRYRLLRKLKERKRQSDEGG